METILEKYNLTREINRGAFGVIYSGFNKITKDKVAIKIELAENSLIKNEARIYNFLERQKGIPKLRMYLTDSKYNYLVIDLLGESLYSLKERNNNIFSLEYVYNIGIQITNILNDIHNMGIVHRDIKPQNIVFDNDMKKVFLIDFGLSKNVIFKSKHIEERKISNVIGSPNYISNNIHKLIEPSRRDDIISMLYVLLYLLMDELPWKNTSLEMCEKIKKDFINNDKYKVMFPNILHLLELYYSFNFNQKPNYKYIIDAFQ